MNITPIAAVAASNQQLIGYWGHGSSHLTAGLLADLLASVDLGNWQISHNSPNGFTAIAADGLLDKPDAWVRWTQNRLTIGRQGFGRTTLYWVQIDRLLWYSSRLQWLLPLLKRPAEIDIAGFYGYTCFSYVPTPCSPVRGIGAIVAGTEQTWQISADLTIAEPTTIDLGEWHSVDIEIADEARAIDQLQNLLIAAVQRQVADLAGQPVGVFLSGGLDSSVVTALLVRSGLNVRAYTLDFGSQGVPEYPYADRVARHLGIPLVKVAAGAKQIAGALAETIVALDTPYGDGVTVPLFLLNRAASRDVSVIFNGEGGDQLFAGWTNKPLIAASIYQSIQPETAKNFTEQYLQTFHRLWGYESQVLNPEIRGIIDSFDPNIWLDPALSGSGDLLARLRRASLMLKGAQNIHPRATNLAVDRGLKVRSPFCDLPLAQWSLGLSGELCLQGACEKYLLKRAVADWLPEEIVWRTKRGMGVPLTPWCWQDWWTQLGTWLNPAALAAGGLWQPDLAARVALGQLSGQIQGRRIGEILWLSIMWQCWHDRVLGLPRYRPTWRHPFWLPRQFWQHRNRWS
jgi:asparagine synthase (glutamine-hydrolysing)